MQCISPPDLECVALSIRKLWSGSQILNLGHVNLTTPTLGANLLLRLLAHVMANACTKYEVSNCGNSKDINGSQNFEIGHVT